MKSPLRQKMVAVSLLACAALGLSVIRHGCASPNTKNANANADDNANANANAGDNANANADDNANADGNPRQILNRPWFDKLPKSRGEEIDLWIFFSSGVGLEDKGSYFRSTFDFFELERQKDKLDVLFLHDKKKAATSFTVKRCDDHEPFDLCLELKDGIRGVKKLYSWGDDEDMDRFVPWASAWKRGASERAKKALAH